MGAARAAAPAAKIEYWPTESRSSTIINGIFWILRTGAPWRDLPERYGSWKTVSSRFYRWRQAGIWERILAALQTDADAAGHLDWSIHFVDIVPSSVRISTPPVQKKGTQKPKRLVAATADSQRN